MTRALLLLPLPVDRELASAVPQKTELRRLRAYRLNPGEQGGKHKFRGPFRDCEGAPEFLVELV